MSLLLLTALFAADGPVTYGQPEKAQRFTMVLLASKQAGEPVAWPMTPQRHRAGVDFSDVHGAARIKMGPSRCASATDLSPHLAIRY